MLTFPKAKANNPALRGSLASPKVFWDRHRYALAAVHTRFDAVEWFVWDADDCGSDGLAQVIRQAATPEEATNGLI